MSKNKPLCIKISLSDHFVHYPLYFEIFLDVVIFYFFLSIIVSKHMSDLVSPRLEHRDLTVTSSTLGNEDQQLLINVLVSLGGHLQKKWSSDSRYLVMPSITLTVKVRQPNFL